MPRTPRPRLAPTPQKAPALRSPADLDQLRVTLDFDALSDLAIVLDLSLSSLSRFYNGHVKRLPMRAALLGELILLALKAKVPAAAIVACWQGGAIPLSEIVTRLVALRLGVDYPPPPPPPKAKRPKKEEA